MRKWIVCLWVCGMLAACFQKTEQGTPDPGAAQTDYGMLRPAEEEEKQVQNTVQAEDTAETDTVDHLHASMEFYTVTDHPTGTDTVWHYPSGRKIEMGRHLGRRIYLELGEFYEEGIYDGARIYWGDSLIYETELSVMNDWQTCRTHHVKGTEVTYVLLLMDDRPEMPFWHIVCMNGTDIHLADYVRAATDTADSLRYFHEDVTFRDIDGDGFIEVGGKYLTEFWEDSMTYQPCYIYKLDRKLSFDEVTSESETRKAYNGTFLGFKNGLCIYNPNARKLQEEPEEEERDQ